MIFAQSALVSWRKRHRRSYELCTLAGLWSIPPIISVYGGLWRFLAVSARPCGAAVDGVQHHCPPPPPPQ